MRSYNHIFIDLDDTVWDFNANSHIALALTYENLHLHNICSDYDRFSSLYYAKNAELWNLYHHGEISRDFLIIERFAFPLRECGYIDKEGITVVPFAYDAGTAVENGECRVKKAGKWGELHIDDPDNVRWIN